VTATRGASHFRQADLTRAVRAIEAAGKKVSRVEILTDGKLVIVTTGSPARPKQKTHAIECSQMTDRCKKNTTIREMLSREERKMVLLFPSPQDRRKNRTSSTLGA
jgi:hypothetical protein